LDPDYFRAAFAAYSAGTGFAEVCAEVSRYYAKEIGTNVANMVGGGGNIYSSESVMELWELILGIAIKGRNR
jgi:hypothetical protein